MGGFFGEEWEQGGAGWERVRARATECARIPAAFLAEERRSMGERAFRQEYLCEFEDATAGVFSRELVEAAMTDDFEGLEI
jgi:phage FluMu gp28-like protein